MLRAPLTGASGAISEISRQRVKALLGCSPSRSIWINFWPAWASSLGLPKELAMRHIFSKISLLPGAARFSFFKISRACRGRPSRSSLRAADRFRHNMDNYTVTISLSQLQNMADRNRALLSSPVRKDLLLQDWLIQWARLGA